MDILRLLTNLAVPNHGQSLNLPEERPLEEQPLEEQVLVAINQCSVTLLLNVAFLTLILAVKFTLDLWLEAKNLLLVSSLGEDVFGLLIGHNLQSVNIHRLAAMKVKDQFYCGGSLINSKMVITAAHCIQTKSNVVRRRDITFVLGGHNLDEDERNSESSAVSTLIVHDDWMAGDDVDADIAIAVLTKTISYTKFIKPICLWTSTSSYDDVIGSKATIAGWGKTGKDLLSTDHPNYVVVPIVELEECKSSHDFFNEIASDRTFCAGDLKVNQSPCSGDSGGGLIVKSGRKWFLRGLVSHGIINSETQKCTPKNYVMFTDVAAFKDWIQEIVDDYL